MKKKKIRRATRAFYAALSYVAPRWNTKLLFLRQFGRLPELNVSGDFFSLLGEDYLGAGHGDPGENDLLCAVKMKVEKI